MGARRPAGRRDNAYPANAARIRAQLRMPLWKHLRSYFSFGECTRSSSSAKPTISVSMHNRERADPAIDIVADVSAFFERSLAIAVRAGIARERIALDPGIGFGKTAEQSLTCIARLDAWRGFGAPLIVGASRKRFIH